MSHFNMSYEEVLESPMQRLILLAKTIPKYTPAIEKEKKKKSTKGVMDFVKSNNLLKK